MDETNEKGERLHRFLARAGIGSRRKCEELIEQGRVSVDGVAVTTMGVVVDPERNEVRFDGEIVSVEPAVYYLVYKPEGVICTTADQFGRTSVVSLVRDRRHRRLFPVGRLEEDSEGLILVTNDGEFANRLAGYKHPIRHTYWVRLRGTLDQDKIQRLRDGVWLSDGKTGPMFLKVLKSGPHSTTVLCSPSAYQHRMLRRAFAKVGVQADKVIRIRIGSLTAEGLKKTGCRKLKASEVEALLNPAPEDLAPIDTGSPGRAPRSAPASSRGGERGAVRGGRTPRSPGTETGRSASRGSRVRDGDTRDGGERSPGPRSPRGTASRSRASRPGAPRGSDARGRPSRVGRGSANEGRRSGPRGRGTR